MGSDSFDWRDEVERILIHASVDGVSQNQLNIRCKGYAETEVIQAHLEMLWAENKVQKFIDNTKAGRPATVWRATNLILKKRTRD
jgi:hypothetical protein